LSDVVRLACRMPMVVVDTFWNVEIVVFPRLTHRSTGSSTNRRPGIERYQINHSENIEE